MAAMTPVSVTLSMEVMDVVGHPRALPREVLGPWGAMGALMSSIP